MEFLSRRTGKGANKYTAYVEVNDTHKRCSWCREMKLHEDYHKDKSNKHGRGLAYYCKVCANEKAREHHRIRYNTLPEYREAKKAAYILNRHGITIDAYYDKLDAQEYSCAICKTKEPKGGWHLDHDHITGEIRDFLCSNCNRGIGHLQEDIDTLKNAISYLTKYRSNAALQGE